MGSELPGLRDRRSDGAAVDEALAELVNPAGYVQEEYFSRLRLLSREVLRSRPSRVLDLGCGHGSLAIALADAANLPVVGLDVLPDRVAQVAAKPHSRRHPEVCGLRLVCADAERGLPFKAESFDVVVATEVLEHLDEPVRVLREINRVLRRGGRLLVTTPNAEALPYRILRHLPSGLVRGLTLALTQTTLHPGLTPQLPSHPDHHRREGFTLRELQALGNMCSLRLVSGFAYRIPLPDKVMIHAPRSLSGRIARIGTRPIPMGLGLYCEFMRTDARTRHRGIDVTA